MQEIEYINNFQVIQEFSECTIEEKAEKDREKLQQLYDILFNSKDDVNDNSHLCKTIN